MADGENGGWTRAYRRRWEHPIFRSLMHAAIWAWMTDTAVWRDTTIRFCDRVVPLRRGQLITSERFIADGFGINRIVVRKLLETLEIAQMISRHIAHGGTIITVCNYEKYQGFEDTDSPPDSPPDSPGVAHAEPTRSPNKKNLRIEESKKEIDLPIDGMPPAPPRRSIDAALEDEFERVFWPAYPVNGGKKPAKAAYLKARKAGASLEEIMAGLTRYKALLARPGAPSPKWAQGWLNDERWKDQIAPMNGNGHAAGNGQLQLRAPEPHRVLSAPRPGTPEEAAWKRKMGIS